MKLKILLDEMATKSVVRKIKPEDRITMKSQKDFVPHSYTQRSDPTFKPMGLWYAKGNAWIKWVRKNMPHWEQEYLYRLDLDYSKILVLGK